MEYSRTVHRASTGVSMNVEVNKGNEFKFGEGLCWTFDKCGPDEISFMAVRFIRKDGTKLRLEFSADHQLSEYSFLDRPGLGGTILHSGGNGVPHFIECTRRISHPILLYRASWLDPYEISTDLPLEWFRFLGVFVKSDFKKVVLPDIRAKDDYWWQMLSFDTVWRLALF